MVNPPVPPDPINYLLVAGEPSDLGIGEPGYWTRRSGSFDPVYSRGAIQFHPIRFYRPAIIRDTDNFPLYDENSERWLHFTLKAFPFDSRERDPYTVLEFCGYSLVLMYKSIRVSELFISFGETLRKICDVSSNDMNEYDIRTDNTSTKVFLNGISVASIGGEFEFTPNITFRGSRRDMLWWSQVVIADRSTIGCKLSTIEMKKRVDDNFAHWSGDAEDIRGGEISDVDGITIKDDGVILFEGESHFDKKRNFIDTIILSSRINTVKEDRDITSAYSQDDEVFSGTIPVKRNRYLENSQITMRINPLKNRRWWYSDLNDIKLGLTAKPKEDDQQ